jgi:putative membrane protein
MSFILKLVVTSLAVFFGAYILDGVYLSGFPAAILVAAVLGLLNTFLKPLLVLLTIPFTLLTLGLFLLVINAAIILIADAALSGFTVDSFGTAVIFSILVSVFTWLLEAIAGKPS